mmetsp:Transcript_18236/g.59507  ORF Transcript_18236/g.59507 Transcript_18236/m.59507 type:complete len:246 (-) Transcript_18236:171-908(-)
MPIQLLAYPGSSRRHFTATKPPHPSRMALSATLTRSSAASVVPPPKLTTKRPFGASALAQALHVSRSASAGWSSPLSKRSTSTPASEPSSAASKPIGSSVPACTWRTSRLSSSAKRSKWSRAAATTRASYSNPTKESPASGKRAVASAGAAPMPLPTTATRVPPSLPSPLLSGRSATLAASVSRYDPVARRASSSRRLATLWTSPATSSTRVPASWFTGCTTSRSTTRTSPSDQISVVPGPLSGL